MNRKKETYDRYLVGERIQKRRQSLGISQEELAERIDRATKYCSDIERGMCGMSIETMLAFSEHLNMSLDYMMYGKGEAEEGIGVSIEHSDSEHMKMKRLLEQCSKHQYSYALRLLELFMEATETEQ